MSDDRGRALLALLVAAADEGRPCPSNDDICGSIGLRSVGSISNRLKALEKEGLIRVKSGWCSRIVTICATGKTTAPPAPRLRRAVISAETIDLSRVRRVDRDPCPFCGTRRDLGCAHGERLTMGAWA